MRSLILSMLLISGVAVADESQIHLKDGAGKGVVQANCSICHSLDYIQMNSPFLDKAGWETEVAKMMYVMGAPVPDDKAKAMIVDYLAANYGKK